MAADEGLAPGAPARRDGRRHDSRNAGAHQGVQGLRRGQGREPDASAAARIHALIGPNGAGKTTCFNLLTHFLTPTRGQIFYNGAEITGSRPAAIARMGLVRSFQISAVFPNLTVLENVRIALQRQSRAFVRFLALRPARSRASTAARAS